MARPKKQPLPPEPVGGAIDDATTAPDGAGRVLVYRTWAGGDDTNRRLGGVLMSVYRGSLLVRSDLRDHVKGKYGPGYYTVVVQQKLFGTWRFLSSEPFIVDGKVTAEFLNQ